MLIYCLWRFLRAFILACVEFIVYFSIKTYLFYFTQLFFKNTTLNYLYTLRFIKYYFFINFYLLMLPNHISSLLKQKSLSLSHTASLTHSFYLSKLIKPKTHTHVGARKSLSHIIATYPAITYQPKIHPQPILQRSRQPDPPWSDWRP